jgi:hypothetical protein
MPKKVSKSIKQKQKQSQSVNIKIGVPEKPKRTPRKSSKKIVSIINTGPVLSSPSGISYTNPIYNARPTFGLVDRTIDDYRSRVNRTIAIPADPRQPIRPIDQDWAYDSGFQQGGSGVGTILGLKPKYLQQFSSDIQEVPSPYKNRSPSIYSISSDESSQWAPEDFRNVASQNISAGLSLETIAIPQQGMSIDSLPSRPVKLEDYRGASSQDLQNAMKEMSPSDFAYGGGGGGFSDDQIQAALTYNSLTPVKSEPESKFEFK